MRRRTLVLLPCWVLLVVLSSAQAVLLAQADPNRNSPDAVGVDALALGSGPPSSAGRDRIDLVRLMFWPGATLGERTEPGMSILYVESGQLNYRLVEGRLTKVGGR